MVLCKCGCSEELDFSKGRKKKEYISGHNLKGLPSSMLGKHHSQESKDKKSKAMQGKHSGNKNPMFGIEPWNKGKHPEYVQGENHPMFGKRNELSPLWKGGKKLSNARKRSKRRDYNFNPLNDFFENSEGHHINNNDIIYIPREWNQSIRHNVITGKNMEIINAMAYFFVMQQNIEQFGSI